MSNLQAEKFAHKFLPIGFVALIVLSTFIHFLANSLPKNFSWKNSIGIDTFTLVLVVPVLYHSFRTMGKTLGSLFFFTITIFMSSLEALWVSLGKLKILGDAYDYTTGALWIFNVPLMIGLGWFLWIYAYYYISNRAFSQKSPLFRSVICGLLCVCTDLWMDPAIVNFSRISNDSNLWNWSVTKSATIFTVPIYNFLGWFFAGTFLVYFFQMTWATLGKTNRSLRQLLLTTFSSWLAYSVITKLIQFSLDALFANLSIFPFKFIKGENLSLPQKFTLAIVPTSMLICICTYLWTIRHDSVKRVDLALFITYSLMIAFNMKMAYAIQIAYPSTFIVYLTIPMGIVFAVAMFRLNSSSKSKRDLSKIEFS